jgi:hypothetical protein
LVVDVVVVGVGVGVVVGCVVGVVGVGVVGVVVVAVVSAVVGVVDVVVVGVGVGVVVGCVVGVVVVGVVGVVVVVRRPGTHRNTTTPGVRSDPHLLPLFRGSQLCSFKERAPKYCAAYPVYVRCAITNFKWW